MAEKRQKIKVGLAASSGGLNCMASLGAINFFKEHNLRISACAGSSGGAFPLAAYCAGLDLRALDGEKIAKELKRTFFDPDKMKIVSILMKFVLFTLGWKIREPLMGLESMGFCSGNGILDLLKYKFGDLTFTDTLIPLYIPAYNISEKRSDLFHQNGLNCTLAEAIRMSASIPLIFRPYSYQNNLYWDSGVQSSLPVKELLDNEPEINFLVVIDTISGNDLVIDPLTKPLSILHAINDLVIGIQDNQVKTSIKYAIDKLGEENVVVLAPRYRCGWADFDEIPRIIEDGYRLAKNAFRLSKKLQMALES